MSHDGQDLSVTPLLSNLMALTGPALAEAQAHFATARQALAALVWACPSAGRWLG